MTGSGGARSITAHLGPKLVLLSALKTGQPIVLAIGTFESHGLSICAGQLSSRFTLSFIVARGPKISFPWLSAVDFR